MIYRFFGVFFALLALGLSSKAWAATEVYSGVDPSPGARPVIEGGHPVPLAVDTPQPLAQPRADEPSPSATSPHKAEASAKHSSVAVATPASPHDGASSGFARRTLQKEVVALRREVVRLKTELERTRSASARAMPASDSAPARTYDPVPSDQAEGIARRLGIVARLVLTYGRAYDYRAHTTRELQSILESLEKTEAPATGEQSTR